MGAPPPWRLNGELSDGLRGARLVLELGLDEGRFATVAEVVGQLAAAGQRPKAIRQSYPALYATYLVFVGVYRYVSGNFWPDVHPGLTGQGYDPGYEFLIAVRSLGLESFDRIVEEEHAQPWVTRILAHGGIPRSCLEPFLDLLRRELARGAVDATELLAYWRVNNARLHGLHQPTRRFLLFGGAPAVDLLDRCIELMRERRRHAIDAAAELGLPRYMAEAIAELPPAIGTGAGSTHRALSVPRPVVRLDPYSGLGPVVVLPAVPPAQADGSWRVDAGHQLNRYDASAVSETPIRLSPASSYAVEFVSASEDERRLFTFEALGRLPSLFLDPDTERLLREPSVLAADQVWVLSPPGLGVQTRTGTAGPPGVPQLIQELPTPAGAWVGWSLQHIDLDGVGSVELARNDEVLARIPVTSARERLRLAGETVAGVTTPSGAPVYASPPVIEIPAIAGLEDASWQIRLTIGEGDKTWAVSGDGVREVALAPLIGTEVAAVTLRVRGPLGFDMREEFAVVEGLEVRRPANLVRPGALPATVGVRAAVAIDDVEPGQWSRRELPEPLTSINCSARTEGGPPLELRVIIARLLWAVVHEGKPAVHPAASVVRVGSEEFDDQLADLIVVTTGIAGTELSLELRAAGRLAGSVGPALTGGRDGRWSFDLGAFTDAIRRSSEGRLRFDLIVNGLPVHVVDVVAKIEVSRMYAQTRIAGDFVEAILTFDQQRLVTGRVARLWSEYRPWDAPAESAIADGETTAQFSGYDTLTPGPYLAEIAVADSWVRPTRPRDGSATASSVALGSREEIEAHLGSLDPGDPRTHITWALSGHDTELCATPDALLPVAGDVAHAAGFALDNAARGADPPAAFRRVAALLRASDIVLCTGLVDASEKGRLDESTMSRVSLWLLEHLEATNEELDPSAIAALWRACPPIAAALDIPWAGYGAAGERCATFLAWTPDSGAPSPAGAQVNQFFLTRGAPELAEIRRSILFTVPGLLDSTELVDATFEWLLNLVRAEKVETSGPVRWFERWRAHFRELTAGDLESPVEALIAEQLDARRPVAGAFPWGAIPEVVLLAAVHYIARTRYRFVAGRALDEALAFAPRLVAHDLVLAIAIMSLNN
jgi:hypothetical protein